jgi:hypothetical protein
MWRRSVSLGEVLIEKWGVLRDIWAWAWNFLCPYEKVIFLSILQSYI